MCAVVGACVFYMCESLKFEGAAVVVMVLPQYFISGTVSVLLCNEALGTSSSLAAEQATVFKPVFSWFSRCSTIMSTEFAVFVPCTKCFDALAIYCGKAYSICDKLPQSNGWRTCCAQAQAILLTSVVTFCVENKQELTPRGVWQ